MVEFLFDFMKKFQTWDSFLFYFWKRFLVKFLKHFCIILEESSRGPRTEDIFAKIFTEILREWSENLFINFSRMLTDFGINLGRNSTKNIPALGQNANGIARRNLGAIPGKLLKFWKERWSGILKDSQGRIPERIVQNLKKNPGGNLEDSPGGIKNGITRKMSWKNTEVTSWKILWISRETLGRNPNGILGNFIEAEFLEGFYIPSSSSAFLKYSLDLVALFLFL